MTLKNNKANVGHNNTKPKESLLHRVLHASSWTVVGHLTNQALRLGGNLVLTRLLFPEAFGLMTIVQSVIFGLKMISDVGIEPAIIHNKRGHESVFVNTAWSMKVIQGVFIWLILCLLAPFLASFYAQPALTNLLPVVGFGAVLGGLESTKLALANRALAIKGRMLIEVGSYAFGLLVTILWAWIDRSIWSLVGGGLVGALTKTISSHLLLEGPKSKFEWESDSVKALFGFGQWILVSSALTFLSGEGNKLLLGAFLGVKQLAFFTLASTMSMMFWAIVQQLSSKVLFPAYSEVVRERPERLNAVVAKSRLLMIVPSWLVSLFFVLWGDHFMWMLYDSRYAESGNMLRMLALGNLVGVLGGAYTGILWAKGMVRAGTVLLVAQIVIQVIGMFIGQYFLGEKGVILSVAAIGLLLYPVNAYVHAKIGLWQPLIDLPIVAISIIVTVFSFSNIYSNL